MTDRKEWELTDEEIRELMVTVSTRELVTAAARKALEWAAFGPCREESQVGAAETIILKELSA